MGKFHTYILKSISSNKHYFGHTSDLEKRLFEHNLGLSTFTKRYIPWELFYLEEFNSRSEAKKREKFFKSLGSYHWLMNEGII